MEEDSVAIARFPFVSKRDIIRAYRPGAEASDRAFRTLRGHRYVSAGIDVRPRRSGRVAGQLRCYSALNIDAAVLVRHDRQDEALEVAVEAGRFEADWQSLVEQVVEDHDFADFDAFRASRNAIAHSLAPVTAQLEVIHDRLSRRLSGFVSEEFVRVSEISSRWATLDVLGGEIGRSVKAIGDAVNRDVIPKLAIDVFLLRTFDLGLGDLALLRVEHSVGASLVSLLAAIEDVADKDFVLDEEFSAYFDDRPLPPGVRDAIAADRERGEVIVIPDRVIPLAS